MLVHYRAVSAQGRALSGSSNVESVAALLERLRAEGCLLLHAEPAVATQTLFAARRSFRASDLALFGRQLATLVEARLPLDKALALVQAQPGSAVIAQLAGEVLERLKEGRTLSQALEDQTFAVPPFFIGMVRAGETGGGGGLADVLARLADYLERMESLKSRVRSALVYPTVLLVTVGLVLTVMLTVVLPQFRGMFEEAGSKLPTVARLVMDAGDLVRAWWWTGPLLLLSGFLWVRISLRSASFRNRWDRVLLQLPIAGGIILRIETVRFARTLGALLANGVPLASALRTCEGALANAFLRTGLAEVTGGVVRGNRFARRLEEASLFPPLALQLIGVGEETSRLQPMLQKIADLYEEEAQSQIARLIALLVPAITIGLGLIVATVVGAIISAMLSVYEIPL